MIPQRETAASKLACGKPEAGGVRLKELDVAHAARRRAFTPEREHLRGDVRRHNKAVRAALTCGGERRFAIAGGDVQDPASRPHASELHQPLADMAVALSLNSLHSIHPTAAASQCLCCASRKASGSIAFDSMIAPPYHPTQCTTTLTDSGHG
jgi:hypothetical protein